MQRDAPEHTTVLPVFGNSSTTLTPQEQMERSVQDGACLLIAWMKWCRTQWADMMECDCALPPIGAGEAELERETHEYEHTVEEHKRTLKVLHGQLAREKFHEGP